jgi:succinoglycan biosynthesis protein ExoO
MLNMKVSVVIPCYNASKFVGRAVASVLAQVGIPTPQIILVNDSSTDNTRAVIRELADEHASVEVYDTHENLGPSGARNLALSKVNADWVAVLDADDAYEPNRLKRLIEVAESEKLDIIADLPLMYDLMAKSLAPDQLPESKGNVSLLNFSDFLGHDDETGLDLGLLQPVFNTRLLSSGQLVYPETLRHAEDCEMYISLTKSGLRFGLLREAYYLFSTRIGAISRTFSPGSVTRVDYLSIAQQAKVMRANFMASGELDPELEKLLIERESRALLANRRYGWSVLRMREYRRLIRWLFQSPTNFFVLMKTIKVKIKGHRGLPD